MSYPSLNASSKALPPPSPKKRLLPSFQKRRFSHDLPMQAPPRPIQHPLAMPSSFSTPTLGSGAQIVSTPEEALNAWRRESIDMRNPQERGRDRESIPEGAFYDGQSGRRSLSQSSSSRNSSSNNPQLPSPPSSSVGRSRTYSISAPTPTLPALINPSSFTATLLSSKIVKLPRQPFPAVEQGDQSTLVQLQIAGQTFIIPLANLQRSSSNLAHFVHACLDIDNEGESDGGGERYSETDDDEGRGTSQRWSSDSELLPPTFSPPRNIRASSLDKLQKLGVLPPTTPPRPRPTSSSASSFGSLAATPRADTFSSIPPLPLPRRFNTVSSFGSPPPSNYQNASNSSPARSSTSLTRPNRSQPSTRFLNILLLRSPEPYIAISYFYSSGSLLPSLKSMLEGENECKGCPLCGEADRARKLRETEAEAKWLGLTALVSLCRAERRRKEVSVGVQMRKGEGWI